MLGFSRLKWLPHLLDCKFAFSEVGQMSLGSLHLHRVTNTERIQMLAHFTAVGEFGMHACPVDFDYERNFSECFVSSDWRVAPTCFFSKIHGGGDEHQREQKN